MAEHIQIGDVAPRVQYAANGSQTVFTFAFPIFADADLAVFVDADKKVLATDYSITGAGDSAGGTVTFVAPPAAGTTVTLRRSIAIARTTDFQESGEFRAKVINDELDTLVAYGQELRDDLGRTIKLNETDPAAALTLPSRSARASKILAFDVNGDVAVSTDDLAEIEGASTSAATAEAAASAASTSAASAASAATAAANAATSSTNAQSYADAAAAAAASNLFSKVSRKAAVDSPYSVVADSDDGTLFTLPDDGAITVNLPAIASAGEGERYGFLRLGGSHTITLARNGADTINGVAGDYAMTAVAGEILLLVADDDTPDNWVVIPWTQATAGTGLIKSGSEIALDLGADNAWTGCQRATPVTDNDGSFDMSAGQDFIWTPTGSDTLEFTSEATGQRGCILLDNSSGHAISLGSEIEAESGAAAALSAAGRYLIGYWCYDGTNVAISFTGGLS